MLFKYFLKPKWQHRNADVRRQAVEALPAEDQTTLTEVATKDLDPSVRRTACKRLRHLVTLSHLAHGDGDATVREMATARYRNLLAGQESDSPSLAERLAYLEQLQDERLLEHLATSARDTELRRAAIARMTSEELLVLCAVQDSSAGIRTFAAERIETKEGLQQILRRIGKKDTNVYRLARQKLKRIAEQEAIPERVRLQCAELCEKVERLGRYERWVQDRVLLDHLDSQWAALEPEAEPQWRERYSQARQGFLTAFEEYRRTNQQQLEEAEARERVRQDKGALLDELIGAATWESEFALESLAERVKEQWAILDDLPEPENRLFERNLHQALDSIGQRALRLRRQHEANERLEELIRRTKADLEQSSPLQQRDSQQLIEDGNELLGAEGLEPGLRTDFVGLREELEERLEKQKHVAEQRLEHFQARIAELEQHLAEGELRKAEPLFQSLQASLALIAASGVPAKRYQGFEAQLHRLAGQVKELQSWRRWGTDQHREELCRGAEELVHVDLPLEEVSLRLVELREEWKALDKGGSPLNHPLWDRFNTAAEQAYERCRPYLEQQAREREQHRQQREALCAQLEEFLAKADWKQMDWKRAARAEQEMRNAWAASGPTDARFRHGLEKRFREAMRVLDQQLSAERNRNLALKKDLIARAEALLQEPDLHRAMDEAKRLQREWHTTVAGRQKDENRLWKHFRAACDAVFARRREQLEAMGKALGQNLSLREGLLQALRDLARPGEAAAAMAERYTELWERWEETASLPLPTTSSAATLEREWREAQQAYRQRLAQLEQEAIERERTQLARFGDLCRAMERLVQGDAAGEGEVVALEAAWQAMGSLVDQALYRRMELRFQQARQARLSGGSILDDYLAAQAANKTRREELCLHLEILSGVASPPDQTQARLAFQVSRLSEHLRTGEKDPLERASRLIEEWYTCGPAPTEVAETLEARFQRAREALQPALP